MVYIMPTLIDICSYLYFIFQPKLLTTLRICINLDAQNINELWPLSLLDIRTSILSLLKRMIVEPTGGTRININCDKCTIKVVHLNKNAGY